MGVPTQAVFSSILVLLSSNSMVSSGLVRSIVDGGIVWSGETTVPRVLLLPWVLKDAVEAMARVLLGRVFSVVNSSSICGLPALVMASDVVELLSASSLSLPSICTEWDW